MTEVMGSDLRSQGLTKNQTAIINYARTMYTFGRDYFSIFRYYTAGINGQNSEYMVGQGSVKRMVAVKPITLDNLKFSGGQVQTELSLKSITFSERIIKARQFAAIFGIGETDKQGNNWLLRVQAGIRKATIIGLGEAIDKTISRSLIEQIPLVEVSNVTAGSRKIEPKVSPTLHKTNFVYRDGDWTTSDADQFNHETVHKVHGFFLDKKARTCVLQLTPTARQMLAKTEQGQKLLDAGGIYGNPTSLFFVDTPHDLAAGNYTKNNANVIYQYVSSTDKLRLASRQIKKNNVDNLRVLFPVNQTMQATNLNSLNDVAAGSFENIEVDPVDLLGAWDIDAVSFGDFTQLNIHEQKNDIRMLNTLFVLSRFGIGSIVNNENKALLLPIRGKKL